MFPQSGHPVIHQRGIEFPQVHVWVILVTPAGEVLQLSPIAVLGLLGASARALLKESLQEELVPPENGAGCCRIKQAADVGQGLRLIHAGEDERNVGNSFGNTPISWC